MSGGRCSQGPASSGPALWVSNDLPSVVEFIRDERRMMILRFPSSPLQKMFIQYGSCVRFHTLISSGDSNLPEVGAEGQSWEQSVSLSAFKRPEVTEYPKRHSVESFGAWLLRSQNTYGVQAPGIKRLASIWPNLEDL